MLWLNKKNFNDVFLIVQGSFIGWITDSMHSAYIANSKEYELELIIFFSKQPTQLETKIVSEEILFYIEDSICDYGLPKVNYRPIILESTIGKFKEREGAWLNNYWPIFGKYDPMPYDLSD